MTRLDRLKKIKFQYLKQLEPTITANWEDSDYVAAAESTLNGLVLDSLTTVPDAEMPNTFLNCELDWSAGEDNDTIVKIGKTGVYVVQDLTTENIETRNYINSPNIGMGYFGKSYYGGAL